MAQNISTCLSSISFLPNCVPSPTSTSLLTFFLTGSSPTLCFPFLSEVVCNHLHLAPPACVTSITHHQQIGGRDTAVTDYFKHGRRSIRPMQMV